ncbi:MAG: cytochrome c3 family protein [Actinomycetota bacterium]|nr:cytochrome c3 family protein [Actinomycetota bacterium]
MRRTVIALASTVFILITRNAFAVVPQTYSDVTGASIWTYSDNYGPTKHEGSYRPFDTGNKYEFPDNPGTTANEANSGPHGSYITTSNKCKTCHAIHRSNGAYYLLRADSPDDACTYCHTGSATHSNRIAYYRSSSGEHARNGHTIGAGPDIPDSSTWQWLTNVTLESASGNTLTVAVREYDTARNRMFRIDAYNGKKRIGPVLLECMTCHQVHNASELIWKPGTDVNGYKLLRASPSGSCDDVNAMRNYISNIPLENYPPYQTAQANVIEVPNTAINASNTGGDTTSNGKLSPPLTKSVYTIWTRWDGPTTAVNDGSYLSVWCADCHNLNIGYWVDVGTLFGGHLHTGRTHPAPYIVTAFPDDAPQCYSCHVADMYPAGGSTASCANTCHLLPSGYKRMAAYSDFPHSGDDGSTKLLGNTVGPYVMLNASNDPVLTDTPHQYSTDSDGNPVTTVYDGSAENIDGVCLRCHADIGVRQ